MKEIKINHVGFFCVIQQREQSSGKQIVTFQGQIKEKRKKKH